MLYNSHMLAVNVTGRFHTKTRIRFILVIMYKQIASFIEYNLTSLNNFKLHVHPKSKNAIHDSEQ